MYLIRKPQIDEVSSIRETVRSLSKSMQMPESTSTFEMFEKWADLVGEYLSSQSKPLFIHDKTLVVAAANPVVAKEIKLRGPSIMNLINGFLNMQVVSAIDVKTGANYARQFRFPG